jgi:prolyl-tRNA synthetase
MGQEESDWTKIAREAGYLFKAPHIKGGMIYNEESVYILNSLNNLILKEFSKEGFNLWSFPNRTSKKDVDILSLSKSKSKKDSFDKNLFKILINKRDSIKEVLRPAGESQIYPFWSQIIRSYKQFLKEGRIILQQRFYRIPPHGQRKSTRLESEVSEGHALFQEKEETEKALFRYTKICKDISDFLGIPTLIVEAPIWDNNEFNDRAIYLCSILSKGVRLFGSIYNQGENLSSKFKIFYMNKKGEKQIPLICDWGMGIFYPFLWHSRDSKGFIIPFEIGKVDIQIIKISKTKRIDKFIKKICKKLEKEKYSINIEEAKNNLFEKRKKFILKGYPIILEIGKRELKSKNISVFIRWKEGKREEVELKNLVKFLKNSKKEFKEYLIKKTEKIMNKKIVFCNCCTELKRVIDNGLIGKFNWCGEKECIQKMYGKKVIFTGKREGGLISKGKFLGWTPDKKVLGKCICCEKDSQKEGFWARREQI